MATALRTVFSLVAVFPLLPSSAFGWGCEGHQIVALLARARLTPAASAAVDRLLRENPIDPSLHRFCKDRPDDLMADSSTWADDARNVEKTAEWHYIDIPLAVQAGALSAPDLMHWCAPLNDGRPGCIVTAVEYEWTVLRDAKQPPAARAKALRYIVHLLGDLTQPLHASDNRDRGGNCTEIEFFSRRKPENLHAIWDYELIARELKAPGANQSAYARKLDEDFSSHWADWGESRAGVPAWAWESHGLARSVAYGDLQPRIPVESAGAGLADRSVCRAERVKVAALDISIGAGYAAQALPVIHEQLARAGYRLAGLLNRTFQ